MNDPLMKTIDVAKLLGVSTRMVLAMSNPLDANRRLERVTLGSRTIRFRREAVEALIAAGASS